MEPVRSRLCCLFIAAALCALAAPNVVKAATGSLPSGPLGPSYDGSFQRLSTGALNGVTVIDKHNVTVNGKTVALTGSRFFTSASMARAFAGSPATIAVGVGAVVAQAAWCKHQSGSFTCAEKQNKETVTGEFFKMSHYDYLHPWQATPKAAGDYWAAKANASSPTTPCRTPKPASVGGYDYHDVARTHTFEQTGPEHGRLKIASVIYEGCQGITTYTSTSSIMSSVRTETRCPMVIDFFDPQYSVPGGPPDAQGKCPSSNMLTATEAEAQTRLAPQIDVLTPGQKVDLLNALRAARDMAPYSDPQVASGPSTVQGTPIVTTTTTPNGAQRTTTTQTTGQVGYSGNTYNVTNITTTNVTEGGTTVSSTETQAEQEEDWCKLNPRNAGCQSLDEPAEGSLESEQRQVNIGIDTRFTLGGSCPADVAGFRLVPGLVMSWQPVCDFATGVKPVVLTVATLAAAFIFIGAVRGQGAD